MISEIRYVARSLLRRKGFASVTVLTLALGIGSATAIYAMVEWFLFLTPSFTNDLYMIGTVGSDGQFQPNIWQPQYRAYSAENTAFSEFLVTAYEVGNVVIDRKPVATGWKGVSVNFFKMLGITPRLGRDFAPGEDVEGRNQEVVLNYNFWKTHLGASPGALGSQIIVNQESCTVVGILGEGQRVPAYCESGVFRPLVLKSNPVDPWDPSLIAIGRTRPGVSREQAEAALTRTKVDIPEKMRWFSDKTKPSLSNLRDVQKIYRPEVRWMMLGAVGFLYAIACLNAANLMLVHMLGKEREISIRLALGSGRWGLIRLLLIESFGLCLCSSLLGALIANWLIPLFRMAARNQTVSPDWGSWNLYSRTYLVLGGLTLLTGIVIAIVPAAHVLRANIHGGLKSGGGAVGESRGLARLRSSFVVLQATFAVVLLVGAGLMVRTFQRLEGIKIGFDPAHRVKVQINFPSNYPSEPKERLATLRRLQDALQRVPDVANVAFGTDSLLAGYDAGILEVDSADGTSMSVHSAYISPGFTETGGLVLKGGKWLSSDAQGDVIINESLARARFGTTDPVGRYIKPKESTGAFLGWQVVGVVGDVRENLRVPAGNQIYMPIMWYPPAANSFVVEMKAEPTGETEGRLQQAIYLFDPRIVTYAATPLASLRLDQLRNEHLALSVLKVLSGIAVLLTVVGMFSLLAYTVDRRMSEFGVRMALGATPGNLISLVMRRGMALTLLGIVVGIGGAMALTRYLQSLLFETPPFDPVIMGSVAVLLALSALAACILPAVKASRPDITKLLKSD